MSSQVSSFALRTAAAKRLLLLGFLISVVLVVWIRQALQIIDQPLEQLVDPSSLIFIPSTASDSNQARSAEQFTALSASGVLEFSPNSILFNVRDPEAVGEGIETAARQITLDFLDANPETTIEPDALLSGKANLYLGDDPSQWGTGLDTFGGVTYRSLYPGIDLAYEGLDGQLKGNYLLAAGADPALIRWRYSEIKGAAVDPTSGELRLELLDGSYLVEKPPVAWQQVDSGRIPVSVAYSVARDGSLGFKLGDYDSSRPLIIDPVVVYETTYNAGFVDFGSELEVDDDGNAYVVGYADFFVIKFDPDGDFDYITVMSGSGLDIGRSAALDNMGHIFVTGWTSSADFPVLNALQSQLNGQTDAFVTKLNTSDGSLVFSTFMGGTRAEQGFDIVYGYDGAIYLAGATDSTNFPITPDALQDHLTLINCFCFDAYVSKIAADGSEILYATYLGGDLTDKAYRIGVDASDNIYIHGTTESPDFPIENPLQASYSGDQDAFVSKIVADGSALAYSTYLGGSEVEYVGGLAVDAAGYAHALGRTQSTNFPTTQDAFQPQFHGDIRGCGSPPFEPLRNCDDIYLTKLDPDGAAYTFSTFLGGSRDDNATDIALDALGQAHIIGHTASTDFPGNDGSGSAGYILISLLDVTGSDLIRTLQVESPVSNAGHGIVVDDVGDFYITGGMNVPSDVYIAKFSENGDPSADLSLQVDAYPDPILAGSKLSLAIVVENNGPSAAPGVVLTDTLPTGVEFVEAEPSQGDCQEASGQVLCSLGVLSSGHSAEITILVRTTAGGTLTNTAQVGSDFADPFSGNNQVETTVTVLDASADRFIFLPNLRN